jgi:competence protein ComEC
VLIAGAPPSAIRAAFMFSLLAIGIILKKDNHPLNTLFAAIFLILLVQPAWLFAIGFQLSCIAVLSLILFYKKIYGLYFPTVRAIRFLWSAVAASIAAELLIAPLVIYYFHSLPVAFLMANLLAMLLMGIIMSLGLAIILLGKIAIIANTLSFITIWLVHLFHTMIKGLQSLNPVSFKYLNLNTTELICIYLIIIATAIFISKKTSSALFTALITSVILLLSINIKQWNTINQQKIVIYNISKQSYTEHIDGDRFKVLSGSNIDNRKKKYAVNENHVALNAWKEKKTKQEELILFNNKKILFLKVPVKKITLPFQSLDYLVIEYAINDFDIPELKKAFSFKNLVITGNQRRNAVQQWKDSCLKYSIPAHFTLLDGAYTINP